MPDPPGSGPNRPALGPDRPVPYPVKPPCPARFERTQLGPVSGLSLHDRVEQGNSRLAGGWWWLSPPAVARYQGLVASIKLPKTKGHHTWTNEEIAQYRAHWLLGTQQRLVLEFALETVSRRGEVMRLGWPGETQHFGDCSRTWKRTSLF